LKPARAHDEFRLAVRLITAGIIDVAPILSGTYPLSQAVAALELAGDRTRFVKLHLAL
jgi:L-idonate 5-dehydrogenase